MRFLYKRGSLIPCVLIVFENCVLQLIPVRLQINRQQLYLCTVLSSISADAVLPQTGQYAYMILGYQINVDACGLKICLTGKFGIAYRDLRNLIVNRQKESKLHTQYLGCMIQTGEYAGYRIQDVWMNTSLGFEIEILSTIQWDTYCITWNLVSHIWIYQMSSNQTIKTKQVCNCQRRVYIKIFKTRHG